MLKDLKGRRREETGVHLGSAASVGKGGRIVNSGSVRSWLSTG